ncbi:hypothetical protein D3OALGA1CA_1818 [Olavius algarvensis associated proteobacterium Delta 3]|nr:hypothetical protein D3OALGA1CA_1818 [Olavius algarvensis associated proteobacterium Delta 3]CAB5136119.1 hypothetical protein D3OALGB2SA_3944 [Olavius algarvensis associated proteobacterium Delta 3]
MFSLLNDLKRFPRSGQTESPLPGPVHGSRWMDGTFTSKCLGHESLQLVQYSDKQLDFYVKK